MRSLCSAATREPLHFSFAQMAMLALAQRAQFDRTVRDAFERNDSQAVLRAIASDLAIQSARQRHFELDVAVSVRRDAAGAEGTLRGFVWGRVDGDAIAALDTARWMRQIFGELTVARTQE
jgi:hypothetical protein